MKQNVYLELSSIYLKDAPLEKWSKLSLTAAAFYASVQ